jgi:hypothetical protein
MSEVDPRPKSDRPDRWVGGAWRGRSTPEVISPIRETVHPAASEPVDPKSSHHPS